jgi:hypothetical protein
MERDVAIVPRGAAPLVAAETLATVADAFDQAELEATAEAVADKGEPAIRPVDAIVTGDAAIDRPATAEFILAPAAEAAIEDETTGDASSVLPNEEKLGEASAAIVVEVTQSASVAAPSQPVGNEPVVTGSGTEPSPTTPVSMLDGRNCDEDF